MIKNVFIDIDNTLLDFDKCAEDSMKKTCKKYKIEYEKEFFEVFTVVNDSLWLKIEKGELTKFELHRIRFNMIFERIGISFDGETFEKTFREFLRKSFEKVDGAEELLKYLSTKYSVFAVSNASHKEQLQRLELAGLSKYVKDCFVSEAIGAEKPSAKFFDFCFEKSKVKKEQTIMIGDSLTADIVGGKDYGLKTIWFNKFNKKLSPLPDFTVTNLIEIKNIL